MRMKIGKYFTLQEFTKSTVAKRFGINNTPNEDLKNNIINLVKYILDPLRETYGKSIIVTSGFRCDELNEKVGGAKNSHHKSGCASDIRTIEDTPEENKKLFDLIIELDLPFDQLIDEYNFDWVHVSFSEKNRKQILHIK